MRCTYIDSDNNFRAGLSRILELYDLSAQSSTDKYKVNREIFIFEGKVSLLIYWRLWSAMIHVFIGNIIDKIIEKQESFDWCLITFSSTLSVEVVGTFLDSLCLNH